MDAAEHVMLTARKALPAAVMIAVIAVTGYVVARYNGQDAIQSADFRNAATAEVRDATGKVVLRGTFKLVEEEDDDIERKAPLAATTGGEVVGEAEVEFATEMPADQEVEFAARGLTAGARYTLIVDGREVAAVVAESRGRIAIELRVPLPGTAPSR
jgi:hypothetical protein